VPTECDVLIVCRQHDDRKWKFKEQHAKTWENIAAAIRHSRPRGFNIAGASDPVAPAVPTPLPTVFIAVSRDDRLLAPSGGLRREQLLGTGGGGCRIRDVSYISFDGHKDDSYTGRWEGGGVGGATTASQHCSSIAAGQKFKHGLV